MGDRHLVSSANNSSIVPYNYIATRAELVSMIAVTFTAMQLQCMS